MVLLLALLLAACAEEQAGHTARSPITVFAAASLTDALEALADSFETAHPAYEVVVNAAATSLLARQIEEGAPADVFFAANPSWMDYLVERRLVDGKVLKPLSNRLVVVGPEERPVLDRPEELATFTRLALADPEHVPAGIYAKEALECMDLWETVAPRVVPTLDVRAALLAVRNGAADAAIVYASDVLATSRVRVLLDWPERCQPEIRYAVARLRGAVNAEGARQFMAFATDSARAVLWEQFGFRPR